MKKICLIIASGLFLLCGCEQQDFLEEQGNSDTALSLEVAGLGIWTADGISKSVFEQGDQIGLHIFSGNNASQNKITYDGTKWSLQTSVLLSESDKEIYAYYPFNSEYTPDNPVFIDHTSGIDYLYSSAYTVNQYNPSLLLEMKHALALIEFEFVAVNLPFPIMIERILIEGTGLHSRAKLDLQTGNLEYVEGIYNPAIIYGWQLDNEYATYGMKVNLMVVPVKATEAAMGIIVNFQFDSFIKSWQFPLSTIWQSGKKYTYRVYIEGTHLWVVQADIAEWTDGGYTRIPLIY
ncbi:fimbrillin family protein [Dysgonomonas macrotermitis]|nr:fimbrillin family protein [Dysgonomonas macrotermitis]